MAITEDNMSQIYYDWEEFIQADWGAEYRAPDYVPGSHPMDRDEVTWHHVWPPRTVRKRGRKTKPKSSGRHHVGTVRRVNRAYKRSWSDYDLSW